jgi:hypothetical protein
MKIRHTLLTLAAIATASGLSFSASAQVFNPDNDSAATFRYQPSTIPAARGAATMPKTGEQSQDGLYVYSGTDRGWVNRQHSYLVRSGQVTHTADCLPHNLPAPVAAYVPALQTGAFGDHGA